MASAATEVLQTGVPNLDRVLGGGILRRSVAMIIGAPGTGKTILAQQIAFHAASRGAAALYLTGYSETHDKLVSHNRGLGFFAQDLIGKQIQFGSLPDLLREGAEETEQAIVSTVRAQGASLVLLDGFRSMRGFLADDQAAAHFLYSLGAKLALLGATTLVIVEGDPEQPTRYPELTVCDIIITLRRERQDSRHRRLLEVLKARGAAPLAGVHPFSINHTGLVIFPRFESVVAAIEPAWTPGRAALGVADLDALIGGGLNVGTATLVAGSPGVGKTTLCLHFTADGVRANEPVLYLGFMESPAQLREKARVFGMDLDATKAADQVRFLVLRGHDLEADEIAALLSEDVQRRGVRRLVVDSAAELQRAIGFAGRGPEFLSALVSYLRGQEITTCLTLDVPTIVGPELEFAGTPLSVIAENLLLLRHVEYRGRLHRVLSVFKMRYSGYEPAIYELTVAQGARHPDCWPSSARGRAPDGSSASVGGALCPRWTRWASGGSVATILIVDDEEPVRDFLAQFLADVGHRTLQAIHGAQALELVEKEQPDLVIADVMMPVLNGAELCRRLKAGAGMPTVTVILMSAAGSRSADGTGADAFISKPFDLEDMRALVHRWTPSPG